MSIVKCNKKMEFDISKFKCLEIFFCNNLSHEEDEYPIIILRSMLLTENKSKSFSLQNQYINREQ